MTEKIADLKLTFINAFFSKVFMINGGMAGSKDRAT